MADLFKSAFGYLGGASTGSDNDFVGQDVEINGIRLRIRKLIAEGKFFFPPLPTGQVKDNVVIFVVNYKVCYKFPQCLYYGLWFKRFHLYYVNLSMIYGLWANREVKIVRTN